MFLLSLRIFQQFVFAKINPIKKIGSDFAVNFRCWPIDIDIFFHMNNSRYMTAAELSRWRLTFSSTLGGIMHRNKMKFLIAEQSAMYYRPILPFQKYIVTTTITISDDKYLNFIHKFEQHPKSVKPGSKPFTYCIVNAKSVFKLANGKTVPVSFILDHCNDLKNIVKSET